MLKRIGSLVVVVMLIGGAGCQRYYTIPTGYSSYSSYDSAGNGRNYSRVKRSFYVYDVVHNLDCEVIVERRCQNGQCREIRRERCRKPYYYWQWRYRYPYRYRYYW